MTLSSRHRIRNSSPGGLRPSTPPLGHGGSPPYWVLHVDGEETYLFLSNRWDRESSYELSGANHYPRAPPRIHLKKYAEFSNLAILCTPDISLNRLSVLIFIFVSISQQTRDVEPMLGRCWTIVYDAEPTSTQHWFNVSCLLSALFERFIYVHKGHVCI